MVEACFAYKLEKKLLPWFGLVGVWLHLLHSCLFEIIEFLRYFIFLFRTKTAILILQFCLDFYVEKDDDVTDHGKFFEIILKFLRKTFFSNNLKLDCCSKHVNRKNFVTHFFSFFDWNFLGLLVNWFDRITYIGLQKKTNHVFRSFQNILQSFTYTRTYVRSSKWLEAYLVSSLSSLVLWTILCLHYQIYI
jgi:hypothetical protein